MNNLTSFNVSKRLNRKISNCGKMLINGDFKVSIKIIREIKEITKTNKYEKKILTILLSFFLILVFLPALIFWLSIVKSLTSSTISLLDIISLLSKLLTGAVSLLSKLLTGAVSLLSKI